MAVNAHQPPKRGEHRGGISSQCREGVEHRIDIDCVSVPCGRGIDRSLDQVLRTYLRVR